MIDQNAFEEQVRIIDDNLSRLRQRLFRNSAMRDAFLQEKAKLFSDSFSQEGELGLLRAVREEAAYGRFSLLCEGGLPVTRTAGGVPGKSVSSPVLTNRMINMMDRIEICRILARETEWFPQTEDSPFDPWALIAMLLGEAGEDSPVSETADARPGGERIAFLSNLYTDLAYERFSAQLSRCTATYYSDFAGMCEALSYGVITASILPLENSEDGKLLRFYHLIDRYDLRIVMATEIPSREGERITKYGLLRRTIEIPSENARQDLFFECRVILEKTTTLSDVLLASSLYGLSLVRADASTIPYREGTLSYDLIFRVGGGDLLSMLVFLTLQTPQFTTLGVYRVLD